VTEWPSNDHRFMLCLFVFISGTMRFFRYGIGASATHNHATRSVLVEKTGQYSVGYDVVNILR
jgi:hypothetical protein